MELHKRTLRAFAFGLVSLGLAAWPVTAADEKPASYKRLLVKRQYGKAAAILAAAAQSGNVTAQYQLGSLYRLGLGVDADNSKAAFWFQKAAAQGNAKATRALKRMRVDVAPTEKKLALRGVATPAALPPAVLKALPQRPVPGQDWLDLAAARGLTPAVQILLANSSEGADRALLSAVEANRPATVSTVIAAKAGQLGPRAYALLQRASRNGYQQTLAALLAARHDPFALDTEGLLQRVAMLCNPESLRTLGGAGITENNLQGAAVIAAIRTCPDAAELVPYLDARTFNVADARGRSALWYAAAQNDTLTVSTLLNSGVDVAQADKKGFTPLHAAALAGQADNLKRLLMAANNKTSPSKAGVTPLMLAAYSGCGNCLDALLPVAGDINIKDNLGNTALMYALRAGQAKTAARLFRAGANPDSRNDNEDTPAKLAGKLGLNLKNAIQEN